MRPWTTTLRWSSCRSRSFSARCARNPIRHDVSKIVPAAQALHIQPHSQSRPRTSQQPTSRPYSIPASTTNGPPSFAFAFDIDGVLLRSSTPIPGAAKALKYLHRHNIPFILLTNGGGKHESARVAELTDKLGVPLSEENFVQSHTPFKQLVEGSDTIHALKDKTILVTGGDGDQCRRVAERSVPQDLVDLRRYGFKNVIIPGDILMANPTVWPFSQVFTDYYQKIHKPLPRPVDFADPAKSLKIDAIFVFSDPRDWALDSQIILDLLLSKDGILGTYSDKNGDASLPNDGWQQDGQPKLYFSNPDLFWAASYHMPRLGQGGFQASLQGVWDATTSGADLKRTVIGKPYPETYSYAESVLNNHRTQLLSGNGATKKQFGKLQRVFMVGDNPESDIRGANDFKSPLGIEWTSCLVETGVFRRGTKPKYAPGVIVDDVLEAVTWALKSEGWKGSIA
ncbi:HAD-superfamily hydrolase [Mollisia scopiformis]|uniref:HAD-superfamily hydrolase n=1 Tax=Mollisia scopiformis TaxID=149040 RepID=A0A194X0J9_MOLSC|nr:HAD-superfamily hydrolase [Mollisia scopiformis]KUJ13723.1 HAD-superfamily hydrolase [Mollisia scopiformis]